MDSMSGMEPQWVTVADAKKWLDQDAERLAELEAENADLWTFVRSLRSGNAAAVVEARDALAKYEDQR
jgi:DNA-directed RNA polymerase subunit F